MDFTNVYEDPQRAKSYAKLEFPGTYYLAFRDIPSIVRKQVSGATALDFGCGTGRSTRFLKGLAFNVVGVDISPDMISYAKASDPDGDYRLVADGDLRDIADDTFDLVLSAFTFDNIPSDRKLPLLGALRSKLKPTGRLINLVSSPDIYVHEWVSFTTEEFPENRRAKDGEKVKIVMLDVEDNRPVEDILCTDERYRQLYDTAGLKVIDTHHPLGRPNDPFQWRSEAHVAPWCIYALGR